MATTKKKNLKLDKVKNTAKSKKEKRDVQNEENVKNSISKEKDLMYNYPGDCDSLEKRKKFRAAQRRTKASFEKKIAKAESKKDRIALKKEAKAWAQDIYTSNHMPTF